jgi:hypothetical protein
MAVLPLKAEVDPRSCYVAFMPIVLQKSENAGWQISRQKTKQATIAY